MLKILAAFLLFISPQSLTVYPQNIIQGDPIIIVSSKPEITFDGNILPTNKYKNKYIAFVGTDIRQKIESHEIVSGDLQKTIKINPRPKVENKMDIPIKLGGNTKQSEKILLQTMALEADTLRNLVSTTSTLWKKKFIYPVKDPVVTDVYGYSRLTVNSTITHKGTDFRAPIGTEVLAMNDGEVRLVTQSRNYGKHIVIDHGKGIFTIYMHLSEIYVKQGQMVHRGDVIGLSGDTGYVEGAHLHLSIKIGTLSIDPMRFIEFFDTI